MKPFSYGVRAVLVALALAVCAPVMAANDEETYRGDMLQYSFKTRATFEQLNTDGTTTKDVDACIPAKTELRGMGREGDNLLVRVSKGNEALTQAEIEKIDKEKAAAPAEVKAAEAAAPVPDPNAANPAAAGEPSAATSKPLVEKKTHPRGNHLVASCPGWEPLETDVVYTVIDGAKSTRLPDRFGFTYGALVVPYKYHFEGSKSFKGNGTIGPFVGWRRARNNIGVAVKYIAFMGASVIEVDREDEEGNSKKESLAGFSYGAGVIGVLKNEFQMGLVFGADKVSKDSDYEDDGKLWGAVAIGFSFGT